MYCIAAFASTIPPETVLPLIEEVFLEVFIKILFTCRWVRLGSWDINIAATPATTGAENEVPEFVLYWDDAIDIVPGMPSTRISLIPK